MGTLQSSFEKVRQIKQKHIPLHLYGQSWESAHPGVRATAAWHERQDALDRLQRQRQLDQLDALNLRTRQPQLPPPPPLPPAPAGAQVGKPRVAKCSTVSKIWRNTSSRRFRQLAEVTRSTSHPRSRNTFGRWT